MQDDGKIEEQAALWVIREDRGFTPGEREAFDAWLAAATAHKVTYLQFHDAWVRADRLSALRKPPPMREPVRSDSRRAFYAIAAALVIFLCGAGGYYYYQTLPGIYTTAVGQQQVLRLADGTTVQLNTDSRLQARVTASSRTLRLEKGEAYFEVVHDAKRPFMVFAGNRKITDIGTKFLVRLDGDRVRVLVTEGRVRVEMADAPGSGTIVDAEHAAITQASETLVAPRAPREVVNALSWRQGILIFDRETLAAAADEFNRYNRKHVTVLGEARDMHIGGRFRANNADVFASLIQDGLGLNVQYKGDEIIISK
jgi:transmembrane sensor